VTTTRKRTRWIRNLQDLVDYWSADDPRGINRRAYKDTACGASVSVQTHDGKWHHNGSDWSHIRAIRAFTVQTIVEGSDATVDSDVFTLPVKVSEVDAWIVQMEKEVDRSWTEREEGPV
jgi:hypothetical protein